MIAIVQTGGTIASAGRPLAPLPAERFRALWQANMPGEGALAWKATARPLDSSAVGPAEWAEIAALVLKAAEEGARGVVCLHGTDTLAFTAAALAMLTTEVGDDGRAVARLGVPLVLTGSMRPLFDGDGLAEGSDARGNVEAALVRAGRGAPGARVVFGGLDLPGARVAKTHTSADAAFAAPNGPGEMTPLADTLPQALRRQLDRLRPHLGRRAVLTVTPHPGDPEHLREALAGSIAALGRTLGAIHLLGFGAGTLPGEAALSPMLAEAAARGVLLVAGSQVPAGRVELDTYAAGAWLARAGAVDTGDMTAAAANAKLHLALALMAERGWNRERALAFFARPIAGERTA